MNRPIIHKDLVRLIEDVAMSTSEVRQGLIDSIRELKPSGWIRANNPPAFILHARMKNLMSIIDQELIRALNRS